MPGAFTQSRASIFDLLLTTNFINILALTFPLALMPVLDLVIYGKDHGIFWYLAGGVCLALFLECLFHLARSYVISAMAARFEHVASCAFMERLLQMPTGQYLKAPPGTWLAQFNTIAGLRTFYGGRAMLALWDLPFSILFFVAVFFLAGELALVPIGLGLVAFIATLLLGFNLNKTTVAVMNADEKRERFLMQATSGADTLKAMALEEGAQQGLARHQERRAEGVRNAARKTLSIAELGTILPFAGIFSIVGLGAYEVINGTITIGALAACALLSARALSSITNLLAVWGEVQKHKITRTRLASIFSQSKNTHIMLPDLGVKQGAISLKNITLSAPTVANENYARPVLHDVSLNIPAGSAICIMDDEAERSASPVSGASLLLNALNGMASLGAGQVLIDGANIHEHNRASVQRSIAYLPSEGALFHGTLLDNLTMFRPDQDNIARDMARAVGLDDIIANMPMGYDTVFTTGTANALSPGIIQRIAIARALVGKPRVLLLDNVDSALDPDGVQQLHKFLERLKGRVTLILVSQRSEIRDLAEHTYVLRNGRLVTYVPPQGPSGHTS